MKPAQPPGTYTPTEVRFVRLLPGPIERVWAYLTDPAKRATWFAGGPMELKVGGRVELFFQHKNITNDPPPDDHRQYHDPGEKMASRVTRCDPPRLLAYTFGEGPAGRESEVIFELAAEGDQVRLVLTHRATGGRDELTNVGPGWHMHLDVLEARLLGTPNPPFWSVFQSRHAQYEKLFDTVVART